MGRLIFVVFTIVPLIEIACFILIGNAIGLWPTLAGVLVTALVGSMLIRMQGIALIREIRETIGRGQLPTRALADAMMVGIAGALLLAPGYFTDLIGILLLIPPVRTVIYRVPREPDHGRSRRAPRLRGPQARAPSTSTRTTGGRAKLVRTSGAESASQRAEITREGRLTWLTRPRAAPRRSPAQAATAPDAQHRRPVHPAT